MPSPRALAEAIPWAHTVIEGGVNFSLFSRTRQGVELLLFDREDDASPSRVIPIDPATNRTYHYWHVFVPGVPPGQIYGYRVEGPSAPDGVCGSIPPRSCSIRMGAGLSSPRVTTARPRYGEGDNAAQAMKSVVTPSGGYDWEGDRPLRHPSRQDCDL